MGFILWLIVGAVAGFVAARVMDAEQNSVLITVGLGIAGSVLVNIILAVFLGLGGGNLLAQFLGGIAGACILIWGYREYKKRQA